MATASVPMLGESRFTVCLQGFQQDTPDEAFEILDQPGMADQSVLFHKPKWRPQTVQFQAAAENAEYALAVIEKARALRRRKAKFFDGTKTVADCLVLAVSGYYRYAGLVLGPEVKPGASWEVTVTAILLPPAEA